MKKIYYHTQVVSDLVEIVDQRRGAIKRATYIQALLWDSVLTKNVRPDDILTGYDCVALGVRGGGKVTHKRE